MTEFKGKSVFSGIAIGKIAILKKEIGRASCRERVWSLV